MATMDVDSLCEKELLEFLRKKGFDDETIEIVNVAGIDGKTFMTLNDSDLKDLFPVFLIRKRVRDLLLAEKKTDDEPFFVTPSKLQTNGIRQPSLSPQQSTSSFSASGHDQDINVVIPYSAILEDPANYPEVGKAKEKGMVIRSCIDQLIRNCGGRPTEHELLLTAKMIAGKYQCLRDRQEEPLRNNYSNLRLALKRRMYNKTPAVTNRGRKPGWNLQVPEQVSEDVQPDPQPCAPVTVTRADNQESVPSSAVDNRGDEESSPEDYEETGTGTSRQQGEDFLKDLKKCGEKTNKNTVWRLLQNTIDALEKEVLEVPSKQRIDFILENYPVFKNPSHLIQHMTNILPVATLNKVKQNLRTVAEVILDYLFAKNMINISRSALTDEEIKVLVAFVHLPKIGGKSAIPGGKLSTHQTLIHALKTEEIPEQVSAEHKNHNWPWILHQRFGTKTTLMLMYRDTVISKVESAVEGVLAVMGLHYVAVAPYAPPVNGALLYIQAEVLEDTIHCKDKATLKKITREIDSVVKKGNLDDVLL